MASFISLFTHPDVEVTPLCRMTLKLLLSSLSGKSATRSTTPSPPARGCAESETSPHAQAYRQASSPGITVRYLSGTWIRQPDGAVALAAPSHRALASGTSAIKSRHLVHLLLVIFARAFFYVVVVGSKKSWGTFYLFLYTSCT